MRARAVRFGARQSPSRAVGVANRARSAFVRSSSAVTSVTSARTAARRARRRTAAHGADRVNTQHRHHHGCDGAFEIDLRPAHAWEFAMEESVERADEG